MKYIQKRLYKMFIFIFFYFVFSVLQRPSYLITGRIKTGGNPNRGWGLGE